MITLQLADKLITLLPACHTDDVDK